MTDFEMHFDDNVFKFPLKTQIFCRDDFMEIGGIRDNDHEAIISNTNSH